MLPQLKIAEFHVSTIVERFIRFWLCISEFLFYSVSRIIWPRLKTKGLRNKLPQITLRSYISKMNDMHAYLNNTFPNAIFLANTILPSKKEYLIIQA